MTTEENWDTETLDLIIDNNEPLYLAKQRLLWAVTRLTPFDVARFIKSYRPSIEAELTSTRAAIAWSNLQYDLLAATWNVELEWLKPRTVAQAIHVGEILAERHRSRTASPTLDNNDDKFRDLSPFKTLGKALGSGYEFDCACLCICVQIGVDIMYVKLPMPGDYDDENERITG